MKRVILIIGIATCLCEKSLGLETAVPNPNVLGTDLRVVSEPIIVGGTHAIGPHDVLLELVNWRIATIKAEYSSEVSAEDAIDSISRVVGFPPKRVGTNAVYGWQFESKKCGVILFALEDIVIVISSWDDFESDKEAGSVDAESENRIKSDGPENTSWASRLLEKSHRSLSRNACTRSQEHAQPISSSTGIPHRPQP